MKSEKNSSFEASILDSSLITATSSRIKYDMKLIDLGDYVQIYLYENVKTKPNEKDTFDLELKKNKINLMFNDNQNKDKIIKLNDHIEFKNIIRSKLECQRIAKANMKYWKSFITLTFKENIQDINYTNKRFKYFIDKVKRVNKDFKYIAIPEFQKRGAVHYHLLTNLKVDSDIIPKRPLKRLFNPSSMTWKELTYYDIKYWNDGYSSAEELNNDCKKVVGYISKYMTKDIDNRLFNHRRYLHSTNLNLPKKSFIDMNDNNHFKFYKEKIQGADLIYQNSYINSYNNEEVIFLEYLK